MRMRKKILLLASQHGNEHLGEKLYAYIINNYPDLLECIDYLVANPRARRQNQRYIESDMNRSYASDTHSYESKQAAKVLQHIVKHKFQLVLDLHTTTAIQDPCLIVCHLKTPIKQYLRATQIRQVVKMSETIAKHSLIGNCPQALSIEANKDQINEKLLELLVRSIKAFTAGMNVGGDVDIFEVSSLLRREDVQNSSTITNFRLQDDSFYPILFGEKAYENEGTYMGFKSEKKYKRTL